MFIYRTVPSVMYRNVLESVGFVFAKTLDTQPLTQQDKYLREDQGDKIQKTANKNIGSIISINTRLPLICVWPCLVPGSPARCG